MMAPREKRPETTVDGEGVAVLPRERTGDGTVDEVGAEVACLETGGLRLGEVERVLEGLVERVEQTVRQTPHEEERRDEREAEVELALGERVGRDGAVGGGAVVLVEATHGSRTTGTEWCLSWSWGRWM